MSTIGHQTHLLRLVVQEMKCTNNWKDASSNWTLRIDSYGEDM